MTGKHKKKILTERLPYPRNETWEYKKRRIKGLAIAISKLDEAIENKYVHIEAAKETKN